MSVGPSQFERFIETLSAELVSIKNSIQEHIRTTRDTGEAANQTWEKIPARLSELRIPPDERAKDDAYRKKQHRQQVFLTWGTWLAFLAAAAYAGVAIWQASLTRQALTDNGTALTKTLGKMDEQTTATNRLATATETANANVLEADRPWFGAILTAQDAIEVGKTPGITVLFINSGKRPARVLISQIASNWFAVFPKNPPYPIPPGRVKSSDVVVPNSDVIAKLILTQKPLDQATVDAAETGKPKKFFIYADIEYLDLRTQTKHFTHSCWEYIGNDPALAKGFYNSGDYNDAN